MYESVLEEKSSFKRLGLTFSSKLDWGSYSISIAKTASNKIGALIRSMKFYHTNLHGVLLSCLGCYSLLLPGLVS